MQLFSLLFHAEDQELQFLLTCVRLAIQDIFTYTLFFQPKLIVEIGVRGGCSTEAFKRAAKIVGAILIGIDLDPLG